MLDVNPASPVLCPLDEALRAGYMVATVGEKDRGLRRGREGKRYLF